MIDSSLIERARAVPIEQIIEQRGIRLRGKVERTGPCPVCNDGHDRFGINVQKQLFNCRVCGAGGDVIALAQFLDGCSFAEAVERLAGAPVRRQTGSRWPGRGVRAARTPRPGTGTGNWARIWAESVDPRGSIVEQYLRSRSLAVPQGTAGSVIRFHAALRYEGDTRPGMVCLYRDIITDEPCGIHRTFLDADGSKLGRKMLGRDGNSALCAAAGDPATLAAAVSYANTSGKTLDAKLIKLTKRAQAMQADEAGYLRKRKRRRNPDL